MFYGLAVVHTSLEDYNKFSYPSSIVNVKRALYCVKDLYSELSWLDSDVIAHTNIFLKRTEKVFDNVMEYLSFQLDPASPDSTPIIAAFLNSMEYMFEFIWYTLYTTAIHDTPTESIVEWIAMGDYLQNVLCEFQDQVAGELVPAAEKIISIQNANEIMDLSLCVPPPPL
jgi:hypothetical protein